MNFEILTAWIGKEVEVVTNNYNKYTGKLAAFLKGDQGYYVLKLTKAPSFLRIYWKNAEEGLKCEEYTLPMDYKAGDKMAIMNLNIFTCRLVENNETDNTIQPEQ
jgi:spore coat polysaccharide biosynthesis protein SpsF (cytidylyltransferase family)